jgi:ribosomal protein S18 acetylase RimI-like enzyme
MVLRPATEADLPALVGLNSGVQELHARHVPTHIKMPSGDPGSAELFRKMLAEPTACTVVAEEGQAVVGYFFAQEVKRDESWIRPALCVFVLEHFAVDPAFRRQGIGTALMGRFLQEAVARGISQTELVCWDFNAAARAFFRQHGFRQLHARMEREAG